MDSTARRNIDWQNIHASSTQADVILLECLFDMNHKRFARLDLWSFPCSCQQENMRALASTKSFTVYIRSPIIRMTASHMHGLCSETAGSWSAGWGCCFGAHLPCITSGVGTAITLPWLNRLKVFQCRLRSQTQCSDWMVEKGRRLMVCVRVLCSWVAAQICYQTKYPTSSYPYWSVLLNFPCLP